MTPDANHPRDALADLLQSAGPRPAPQDARFDRARAAAHAAWQEEVRIARRRRVIRLSALSLAAAAMLVLAVVRRERPATPPPAPAVVATLAAASGPVQVEGRALNVGDPVGAGTAVRTGPGARASLHLANGAELRLDEATDVRFPAATVVSLARGGLFFDTGSDPGTSRSIEVRTAFGRARDIGTRFEVRLVDAGMRVRVREGMVQVESGGASHRAGSGFELVADADHRVTARAAATAGRDWDWVALAAEPFQLDGKTVKEFLDWVSREGGWPVRFGSEALARSASSIVVRGSMDGLTPEQALSAVLPTCGLTHRIQAGVVIVESAEAVGGKQ